MRLCVHNVTQPKAFNVILCFVATSTLTVKNTEVVSARDLTTGAVVGIASAAFLLGLGIATVGLLGILRYVGVRYIRYKKCTQSVQF